ncbi:hypothetical protein BC939DRAFT_467621 [Gamsiella multidivaricata]|uniref:uncharacterized protein n=1 Tax=Gamsiella multidivaricata TaxID=101098 RepID=UPI002220F160|nr:uncharacterized protein BC939DRAFT_467621 [Gamsiella multidivaricata]KAI7816878.1 hypothetical protein BC939DRAFT_467621 [Gamsiella multidivaricata]
MEVCHSSSNMSLLDQLFGTDGRKHKNEGIWNWVKNQTSKHKNKNKDRDSNGPVLLARSFSCTPASTHNRSDSSNSSRSNRAASYVSFTCSPTSPTSSFALSYTQTSNPHDSSSSSPSSSSSSSSPSSSSSSSWSSSPTKVSRAASPSSNITATSASKRAPYLHSRQRTQSVAAPSMQSPAKNVGNGTQEQLYRYPHQSYSHADGPIKRSTSARSAPAHLYTHRRGSVSHESLEGRRALKGKRVQRDTMNEISETESNSSTLDMSIGNQKQQQMQRWGGSHGESALSDERDRTRARSIEIRHAKRDDWWWE